MKKIATATYILLVSSILLFGCSPHFYGIKMNEEYYAKDFLITGYTKRHITYFYDPSKMDSSITAYALFKKEKLYITIINHSSDPISTDYEGDTFIVKTKTNKKYYLKKEDYPQYPQENYISSGQKRQYIVSFPFMIRKLKRNEIEQVGCSLGKYPYKTIIVLKPVITERTYTIKRDA